MGALLKPARGLGIVGRAGVSAARHRRGSRMGWVAMRCPPRPRARLLVVLRARAINLGYVRGAL